MRTPLSARSAPPYIVCAVVGGGDHTDLRSGFLEVRHVSGGSIGRLREAADPLKGLDFGAWNGRTERARPTAASPTSAIRTRCSAKGRYDGRLPALFYGVRETARLVSFSEVLGGDSIEKFQLEF